jgi:hypothetical protein
VLDPQDIFISEIGASREPIPFDPVANVQDESLDSTDLGEFKRRWNLFGKVTSIYTIEPEHVTGYLIQKSHSGTDLPEDRIPVDIFLEATTTDKDFDTGLWHPYRFPNTSLKVLGFIPTNDLVKPSEFVISWRSTLPPEITWPLLADISSDRDPFQLVIVVGMQDRSVDLRSTWLTVSGGARGSVRLGPVDFQVAFPSLSALGDTYDNVPLDTLAAILNKEGREQTSTIQVWTLTIPEPLFVRFVLPWLTVILLVFSYFCWILYHNSERFTDEATSWAWLLLKGPLLLSVVLLVVCPSVGLGAWLYLGGISWIFAAASTLFAIPLVHRIYQRGDSEEWIMLIVGIFFAYVIYTTEGLRWLEEPNGHLLAACEWYMCAVALLAPLALIRRPRLVLSVLSIILVTVVTIWPEAGWMPGIAAVSIASLMALFELLALRRSASPLRP